ncbi:hypothetical protein Tco_0561065 [Tanacetum coccineum]
MITTLSVLISVSVSTSYACRVRSAARKAPISACCASTVVRSALTSERAVMDDPNITMEEYIQLMANKTRGRDQTFNWETATYGEVYCEDLDSFTEFETDFPAIVYNDASTPNQNVSSEPTVSIFNAIKSDIDFRISFSDFEDEDYTFIYNKDSSSYKLIPANDLKPNRKKTWDGVVVALEMGERRILNYAEFGLNL